MAEFFLSPLASWFGVSIPVFLLIVIAVCSVINILRG